MFIRLTKQVFWGVIMFWQFFGDSLATKFTYDINEQLVN